MLLFEIRLIYLRLSKLSTYRRKFRSHILFKTSYNFSYQIIVYSSKSILINVELTEEASHWVILQTRSTLPVAPRLSLLVNLRSVPLHSQWEVTSHQYKPTTAHTELSGNSNISVKCTFPTLQCT